MSSACWATVNLSNKVDYSNATRARKAENLFRGSSFAVVKIEWCFNYSIMKESGNFIRRFFSRTKVDWKMCHVSPCDEPSLLGIFWRLPWLFWRKISAQNELIDENKRAWMQCIQTHASMSTYYRLLVVMTPICTSHVRTLKHVTWHMSRPGLLRVGSGDRLTFVAAYEVVGEKDGRY